ncbi:MAG TPA: hypothetical protein VKH44_08875 [Pirellulaceae bacterium]|nr:hypothetical protein [Pirellulaceae bacterium]
MKGAFCLAGLLLSLSASLGCSQPQSAATDQSVARQAVSSVAEAAAESPSAAAEKADTPPENGQGAAPQTVAVPPAPSSESAKGQRPPADRARTRPGDAEKITWDDLNLGMQADVVFRPFMISAHDRVKDLEGKRISIVGYMHGGQSAQRGIKEFILLKNTQCKFGPGGQADHLANVLLRADNSLAFTPSPVKVEGTLKLEPFQGPDGNTWSIYRLEDAQIR